VKSFLRRSCFLGEQGQVASWFRCRRHSGEPFRVAELNHAVAKGCDLFRCHQRPVPRRPQIPHGHPCQVAKDDAPDIAVGGSASRRRKLHQILVQDRNQPLGGVEQPSHGCLAGVAANEYGVDDRGRSAVNVDRPAHLGGARQRGRAGKASVQDGHADRAVGVESVVMVGEHQGRAGFQGASHAGIDLRQSLGEVFQVARLGGVSGQLRWRARRRAIEAFGVLSGEAAQPDVAKVHEFAVLHVPEVGRVSEHAVETVWRDFDLRGVATPDGHAAAGAIQALADPLAFDRYPDLALAEMLNLVGCLAIPFRADELVHDIRPAARSDVRSGPVDNPQNVGLALYEADREPVNGEDVQRLERHRVVAAQHVLISQQIGQIGRERVANSLILCGGDKPAAQFKPEELARIEHLAVARIAPPVQAPRLVAGRNAFVRHEAGAYSSPSLRCRRNAGKVLRVGLLEEAPPVSGLAVRIVVLDGEEPVVQRAAALAGIGIAMAAMGTIASAPAGRPAPQKLGPAPCADARVVTVLNFVKVAAGRTDHNSPRVSPVLGKHITGKEVEWSAASLAGEHLDPEERFDRYVLVAMKRASGAIVAVDLDAERFHQNCCGPFVGVDIQLPDLLTDNPGRHRVDVEPFDIAADAVRLDQGRAAAHEGIGDLEAGETVRSEERLSKPILAVLRQEKAAKESARPTREPLVDRDDRPVILLDLLLAERHPGNERNVESTLDAHRNAVSLACVRLICSFDAPTVGPIPVARS